MPTVTIDVSLDKAGNPQVVLTDRNKKAANGDTIKWMKKDNNDSFLIISLAPTGANEVFSTATLSANGRWLTSVFDSGNSPANTPFPYTLKVRSTGLDPKTYDTTESGPPLTTGKPVIRN